MAEPTAINIEEPAYVGRFAPSPSGPLHLGSLFCAVASYLDAKSAKGTWLLRIEDVDTTRIQNGASERIQQSLQDHGLQWDGGIIHQTQRFDAYAHALAELQHTQQLYACNCTRQQIKQHGRFYTGTCRNKALEFEGCAWRLQNPLAPSQAQNKQTSEHSFSRDLLAEHCAFYDRLLGLCEIEPALCMEDPVLRRKDGIYAYHLAVVIDDIFQGVNHIVRGADLLDTTPIHRYLYSVFKATAPSYMHIPVLCTEPGQKLSKQNHAPAIKPKDTLATMQYILVLLGFDALAVRDHYSLDALLNWAIGNWQHIQIPAQTEILISCANPV